MTSWNLKKEAKGCARAVASAKWFALLRSVVWCGVVCDALHIQSPLSHALAAKAQDTWQACYNMSQTTDTERLQPRCPRRNSERDGASDPRKSLQNLGVLSPDHRWSPGVCARTVAEDVRAAR